MVGKGFKSPNHHSFLTPPGDNSATKWPISHFETSGVAIRQQGIAESSLAFYPPPPPLAFRRRVLLEATLN